MNGAPGIDVKPKKKKRSFLADDDFFNMKKARPRSPKTAAPSPGPSDLKVSVPTEPKHENGAISTETPSEDENGHGFHSANASFADSELPLLPLVLVHEKSGLSGPSTTDNGHFPVDSGIKLVLEELGLFHEEIEGDLAASGPKNGSILPTPSQLSTNIVTKTSSQPLPLSDDEDDEDGDLKEFFSGLAQKKTEVADEHDRIYLVKVTSRVGRPYECVKQITGETTFGELVEILLQETLREFKNDKYWSHGVLVWIEGRSELKPIFKPKTLRIPEPVGSTSTPMSCLFIPTVHVLRFEELYPEFQKILAAEAQLLADAEAEEEDVVVLDEAENTTSGLASEPPAEESKSEYFVIGLKGKDNKRIEAEVGPSTKIRSVLKYYMETKGITPEPGREGRILFEDEALDLDAVVGDTELEEDFEVQVYI